MYESYCWFCREKGLPVDSDQRFSRKLSQELHLRSKQFRINGKQVYCWYDLEMVNWKALDDEEQKTLEDIGEFTEAEREALK